MGAAAHKQLRAGLGVRTTTQTTNTTEHDKAKASVTILDAIRKYQTNYPNERIGVEKGYNPVLFKRAVMEASQEYRCELALSELSDKDIEELGLQYFDTIVAAQPLNNLTSRPSSINRPPSFGGQGLNQRPPSNGNNNNNNPSNSTGGMAFPSRPTSGLQHTDELWVEDIVEEVDVDDDVPGSGVVAGRGNSIGQELESPPQVIDKLSSTQSTHHQQNGQHRNDHHPSRPENEYAYESSPHQLFSATAEGQGLGAPDDSVNMSSPVMTGTEAFPSSPLVAPSSSSSRRPLSSLLPISRPSSSAIVNNHVITAHGGVNVTPRVERMGSGALSPFSGGGLKRSPAVGSRISGGKGNKQTPGVGERSEMSRERAGAELSQSPLSQSIHHHHRGFDHRGFDHRGGGSYMEGVRGERLSGEKAARMHRAASESLWVDKDEEDRDHRWMSLERDDDDDEEGDGRLSPAGQDFSWVGISTFETGYGTARTTRSHDKDKGARASVSPEDHNNEMGTGATVHRHSRHHRHSNGNSRRRVVVVQAEEGSDVGSDYEEQQSYYLSREHSEPSSTMLGLHRQKAMSTAQNEQLQKEVDALQKQLRQLEHLEGEMEMSARQTGLAVAAMNHVVAVSSYRKQPSRRQQQQQQQQQQQANMNPMHGEGGSLSSLFLSPHGSGEKEKKLRGERGEGSSAGNHTNTTANQREKVRRERGSKEAGAAASSSSYSQQQQQQQQQQYQPSKRNKHDNRDGVEEKEKSPSSSRLLSQLSSSREQKHSDDPVEGGEVPWDLEYNEINRARDRTTAVLGTTPTPLRHNTGNYQHHHASVQKGAGTGKGAGAGVEAYILREKGYKETAAVTIDNITTNNNNNTTTNNTNNNNNNNNNANNNPYGGSERPPRERIERSLKSLRSDPPEGQGLPLHAPGQGQGLGRAGERSSKLLHSEPSPSFVKDKEETKVLSGLLLREKELLFDQDQDQENDRERLRDRGKDKDRDRDRERSRKESKDQRQGTDNKNGPKSLSVNGANGGGANGGANGGGANGGGGGGDGISGSGQGYGTSPSLGIDDSYVEREKRANQRASLDSDPAGGGRKNKDKEGRGRGRVRGRNRNTMDSAEELNNPYIPTNQENHHNQSPISLLTSLEVGNNPPHGNGSGDSGVGDGGLSTLTLREGPVKPKKTSNVSSPSSPSAPSSPRYYAPASRESLLFKEGTTDINRAGGVVPTVRVLSPSASVTSPLLLSPLPSRPTSGGKASAGGTRASKSLSHLPSPHTPLGSAQGQGLGLLGVVRTGGFSSHRSIDGSSSRGGNSGTSSGGGGGGGGGGSMDIDVEQTEGRHSQDDEEGKRDPIISLPDHHHKHHKPKIATETSPSPSSSLLPASSNDHTHHHNHSHHNDHHEHSDFSLKHAITSSIKVNAKMIQARRMAREERSKHQRGPTASSDTAVRALPSSLGEGEDQEDDEGKGEYTYDYHEERKKEKERERERDVSKERDGEVVVGISPSESSSVVVYHSASELSDNGGTEDEAPGGGARRGANGGRRRVTMMAGKVISRRRLRVTDEGDDKDKDTIATHSHRNNNDDMSTDTPSLPVKKISASFIVHPTTYTTTTATHTTTNGSNSQSPSQPSSYLGHNTPLIIQHKSVSTPSLLPPRSRPSSPSTPAVTTNTVNHTPSAVVNTTTGPGSSPSPSPVSATTAAPIKKICTPVWNDDLDARWGEVDFLLRRPLLTEEDILYTIAATEAGLMFIEQLNILAKSLGVLRGTLSRWLLPYDHNTRIDEQSSTPHSVLDNMPEICRGNVTERQVHYLVAGANGVRRLVRIKIADDNDLEQARVALVTTMTFFKRLQAEATRAGVSPFEVFQLRE